MNLAQITKENEKVSKIMGTKSYREFAKSLPMRQLMDNSIDYLLEDFEEDGFDSQNTQTALDFVQQLASYLLYDNISKITATLSDMYDDNVNDEKVSAFLKKSFPDFY